MGSWSRAARTVLPTAFIVAGAGGCITPVTTGGDRTYVGLYSVESRTLSPTVAYERLRGVGFSVGRTGFGVGYSDLQTVIAEMDEEGCEVSTPLCDIATGAAAERGAPWFAERLASSGGKP